MNFLWEHKTKAKQMVGVTHTHTCFKFDPAEMVVDGDDNGGNSDPHIPNFYVCKRAESLCSGNFPGDQYS